MKPKPVYIRYSNVTMRDTGIDGKEVTLDSIAEHIAILEKKKAVLWGIWKKDNEKLYRKETTGDLWYYDDQFHDEINEEYPIDSTEIYLINITANALYHITANILCKTDIDLVDRKAELIPDYYKKDIESIEFWLYITAFNELSYIEFEPLLQKKCNFSTSNVFMVESSNTLETVELGSEYILHLSDLHFCPKCPYLEGTIASSSRGGPFPSLFSQITQIIPEKSPTKPGLIIVSGDFIHASLYGSSDSDVRTYYNKARDFLHKLCSYYHLDTKKHLILVPGNHDIRLLEGDTEEVKIKNNYDEPYRKFQHSLIGHGKLSYIKHYHFSNKYNPSLSYSLYFSCFNSSDLATKENKDYGYIEDRQLRIFDTASLSDPSGNVFHFSVMHHPIMGPHIIDPFISEVVVKAGKEKTYQSNPVSILSNRFDICSKLIDNHVSCCIHGHQHVSYHGNYIITELISKESKSVRMPFIVAGSTSLNEHDSGMYKGTFNSFNLYHVKKLQKYSKIYIHSYKLTTQEHEFSTDPIGKSSISI